MASLDHCCSWVLVCGSPLCYVKSASGKSTSLQNASNDLIAFPCADNLPSSVLTFTFGWYSDWLSKLNLFDLYNLLERNEGHPFSCHWKYTWGSILRGFWKDGFRSEPLHDRPHKNLLASPAVFFSIPIVTVGVIMSLWTMDQFICC